MTEDKRVGQGAEELVLPEVFARLRAYLREDDADDHATVVERALGIADLAPFLLGSPPPRAPRELHYAGHPFEVIPFAWNGGDALVYAILWHDMRVSPAFVSYAPGDDPPGPVWLADDAESALLHLMAVRLRDVGLHAPDEDFAALMRADALAAVDRLTLALGLTRVEAPEELSQGARSERFIEPEPPQGWVFEPCNDEVGVLAPAEAFDPAPIDDEPRAFDADRELAAAAALRTRGYPASALAVARNVYLETSLDQDRGVPAAREMQRAYAALGRDFLVRRVDEYVRAGEKDGG